VDRSTGARHRAAVHVRNGAIEILAGSLVLLSPKWGSLVVALWLAGIVVNLLTANAPEYYDIGLRDFGLFLAALTLNRLATEFGATTVVSELRPHAVPEAA
jgi:hypothetical protein